MKIPKSLIPKLRDEEEEPVGPMPVVEINTNEDIAPIVTVKENCVSEDDIVKELSKLTCKELRDKCKEKNLSTSGVKHELSLRLARVY